LAEVKVTKKDIQEAKRPDAVLEGATSVYDWIIERRNLVLGALVALIVLIGAISIARASAEKSSQKVGGQLSDALALGDKPVIEKKEATPDEKSFPSKDARNEAVDKALQGIVQEHAGTASALTADVSLGARRLDAGKPEEAIPAFEKYLAEVPTGGLRLFVTEALGYAYEAKGDSEKAQATFAKLADEGAPGLALFHKARLEEKGGKKDEAKKLYEQVAKDYSTEQVANEARTRLELMDVPPAGTGELKAPEPAPEEPAKGKKKQPAKAAPAAPAPKAPAKKKGK
jgi:tetratricopeptide (TPR) repeat protein